MNLIDEQWLPVRLADGTPDKIAPYQITRDIDDEKRCIIAIASPRPDFDGALIQFLIGLLQTACTPETEDKWWDWRESPPAPELLKNLLKPYAGAFNLYDIKKPQFMQEDLSPYENAKPHPVSYLLIGAATDNALKNNTDHFQKRPVFQERMCPSCAAAALYTLQTFASGGGGGGDGKFTGLRGGGPLTTIILGKNLWETIWMNVLVKSDFSIKPCGEKTFPWLKMDYFLSGKTSVKTIHSDQMNPEHVYWGMPRRIQLLFSEFDDNCRCSICGISEKKPFCYEYKDLSGGLTYRDGKGIKKKPSWISPLHPLSPYSFGDKGNPSAIHPQPGGICYRHWLGLVENLHNGGNERLPARVVEQFRTICYYENSRLLWAFGYDFVPGQANVRCWYDTTMPILNLNPELAPLFVGHVQNMIKAAHHVSGLILSAHFKATMMQPVRKNKSRVEWNWPKPLLKRLKTSKKKILDAVESLESTLERNLLSQPISIRQQFWSATEEGFYRLVYKMREALISGTDEKEVLLEWLEMLRKTALHLFDMYSQNGDYDAARPQSIALARNELSMAFNGNYLRTSKLGLPKK